MKVLAVGDIFITPDMMRSALEKHEQLFDSCKYLFFGKKDRKNMRDTVKLIACGGRDKCTLPKGYLDAVEEAEVLMVHLCPVTEEVLNRAKNLKYILCNRGGTENVDVDAASARKIKVLTNPAHNANAVAEFTIGTMFCELRNIARSHLALKNGDWREKYPNSGNIIELKDLTVGIVGFGNVGELVCEKLSGFGCNILISNLFEPEHTNPRINWDKVRYVELEELLTTADVISLHARSRSKKPIFGKKEFDMMKSSAYFINTSRSYMVDYDALYEALNEQLIEGAAIDVFEVEPLGKDHPFLSLDNITLTNHRGGDTVNAYADSPQMMLDDFVPWITEGKLPKFSCNKGEF
jgi:D-3-phosphoglycerate dehydrogenase